ncbi:hypothetical protein AB434_2530 [Heyndrickxia coagulans]|uniref:Uncharacterized protein n=1 Tax=Heyndrickxia coagulans TaxID=1398 RepID=A0AAN0T6U5_HEYCO|nr:hypothetical protein SB48_HM08orf04418 [Heyndrickxia coagulans]AKN54935.1 hypothetical protein AB434_2530 [Heyndrickxia coagulans]KYC63523.1 hypothetical protein B4100_0174 [Heyndrickxia coagulans]KYC90463.1 hypothetical protein B4096_0127 [Heyndrickxia coagulans]
MYPIRPAFCRGNVSNFIHPLEKNFLFFFAKSTVQNKFQGIYCIITEG